MYRLVVSLFSLMLIFLVSCEGGNHSSNNYQSWYVPGRGTININYRQLSTEAKVVRGELSQDIIVLSDVGLSVDYINRDGSTKWRHYTGERCRGLHRWDEDSIYYINEEKIIILDIASGETINTINPIKTYLNDFQRTDTGFIAAGYSAGPSNIFLLDKSFNIIWTNPHESKYPRSAIKVGNIVVIADTFAHRIYGVDINTGDIVFETDDYFPNMVIGEHSNRVYTFDYETGKRKSIYSCNANPFNDVYSTTKTITSMEHDPSGPLLLDPSNPTNSKSICAGDLYSPNGAAITDNGGYFIASSDDGTVLEVNQSGELQAVVAGFNNPINIVPIP